MSDLPAGKGGGPSPFVNAFDHPQLNSLRYNISQAGSAVPLLFGVQRVTVNLLEFWGFTGSSGGKGGKGLGNSGGKKGSNQQFAVNVALGLCQGPITFTDGTGAALRIWANGGVAAGLAAVGLNGYSGTDAQPADPVSRPPIRTRRSSAIPAPRMSPARHCSSVRRPPCRTSRSRFTASWPAPPARTFRMTRAPTGSSPIC